ncbi:MAG TPA: SDR family oxidoreductase [Chlamydiales bacterium]|nr:SDR family oxidoreductase [Chlamydiales bacterium]
MHAENTTVVLCATSEMGQQVVETISERKKEILCLGRNEESLNQLKEKYDCNILQIDLKDLKSLEKIELYFQKQNKKADGLVLITPRPSLNRRIFYSEKEWQEMFEICFLRPLEVIHLMLPYFDYNSQIVILSGLTSVQAMPEYLAYGVLRKMWLAQAKSFATQLGEYHIGVNTVSPGVVKTKSHLKNWKKEAEKLNIPLKEYLNDLEKTYPSNKLVTPLDVAEAIDFFLQGKANITGQNLVVDGGKSNIY